MVRLFTSQITMTNKLLLSQNNVDSARVGDVQTSITPGVKESAELGLCLGSVTSLPSSNTSTSQDSASWPHDEAHLLTPPSSKGF